MAAARMEAVIITGMAADVAVNVTAAAVVVTKAISVVPGNMTIAILLMS